MKVVQPRDVEAAADVDECIADNRDVAGDRPRSMAVIAWGDQ